MHLRDTSMLLSRSISRYRSSKRLSVKRFIILIKPELFIILIYFLFTILI